MMATALPTGIHVAFISVPSRVQVRVLIGLGQVVSTPTGQHRECHIAQARKNGDFSPQRWTADGPSA